MKRRRKELEPNLVTKKIIEWLGVGLLSMTVLLPFVSRAADIEYEVKAALLYKAIKFVQWPESAFTHPSAPVNVCILGDDPFGQAMDPISGLPLHGRAIQVKRFAALDEDVTDCQVLFVAGSESDRLTPIFAAVRNKPILTISEIDQFAQLGGAMNFSARYNRIRFEVNADMVRRAGLEMNAQFMRMVTIVKSKTGGNP